MSYTYYLTGFAGFFRIFRRLVFAKKIDLIRKIFFNYNYFFHFQKIWVMELSIFLLVSIIGMAEVRSMLMSYRHDTINENAVNFHNGFGQQTMLPNFKLLKAGNLNIRIFKKECKYIFLFFFSYFPLISYQFSPISG